MFAVEDAQHGDEQERDQSEGDKTRGPLVIGVARAHAIDAAQKCFHGRPMTDRYNAANDGENRGKDVGPMNAHDQVSFLG